MKKTTNLILLACLAFFWQAGAQNIPNSISSWQQHSPVVTFGERAIFSNPKIALPVVNTTSVLVDCNQVTPATPEIEEGYANLGEVQVANDLVVPANRSFSVESLSFNTMVEAGIPVQSVDIYYYSDSGNGPGTLIGSNLAIVPSSVQNLGVVNGHDHLTVSVNFNTPIDLVGNSFTTIYWIGIQISIGNANAFMEITNTNMNTPNEAYVYSPNTQSFRPGTQVIGGDPGDGVLSIFGTCQDLDDCEGAPDAGTVQGPDEICPGIEFLLQVTGVSQGLSGLNYQWQKREGGADWQAVESAMPFELYQEISVETEYRYMVHCGSDAPSFSNTLTITIKPVNQCHCIPVWQTGCQAFGDYIKDFILVGENGTELRDLNTTCPTGSYEDSTAKIVDLAAGSEYLAQVASGAADDYVAVWIDFNDNGIFDSDELIGTSGAINGTLTNLPLNIPAGAPQGVFRMRVFMHYWELPTNPCEPAAPWGMVRDYSVNVVESLAVVDHSLANFSFYPNPAQDQLNLQANDIINEVVLYNLLGQQLLKAKPESRQTQIDVQALSVGSYIMKVVVAGNTKSFKIVKD